jgi:hypothetical protein
MADIRLAASYMTSSRRQAFQAEMALKYCNGSARQAEIWFGWSHQAVTVGLGEKRTGIICQGAQSEFGGNKRWEERHSEAAEALKQVAEVHAQQAPTFRSSTAYTRLTAAEVSGQLKVKGYSDEQLPAPSTMAVILNRLSYRLRKVAKAKPQKNGQRLICSSRTFESETNRPGFKG